MLAAADRPGNETDTPSTAQAARPQPQLSPVNTPATYAEPEPPAGDPAALYAHGATINTTKTCWVRVRVRVRVTIMQTNAIIMPQYDAVNSMRV